MKRRFCFAGAIPSKFRRRKAKTYNLKANKHETKKSRIQ